MNYFHPIKNKFTFYTDHDGIKDTITLNGFIQLPTLLLGELKLKIYAYDFCDTVPPAIKFLNSICFPKCTQH
jgi:hypothetical protein